VSSQLLEYEVWNRIHAYGLGRSHANEAQALLMRVDLIEMTATVLARALDRRQTVELASYDNRLLATARALGISVAAL
jgi:predicted nucleic acid-binding protein